MQEHNKGETVKSAQYAWATGPSHLSKTFLRLRTMIVNIGSGGVGRLTRSSGAFVGTYSLNACALYIRSLSILPIELLLLQVLILYVIVAVVIIADNA